MCRGHRIKGRLLRLVQIWVGLDSICAELESRSTEEGGKAKKKKVEKHQHGRQKSGQNIGNHYQMEDNKAAPSAPPPSRRPLGVLVVFHLVRIPYVLA